MKLAAEKYAAGVFECIFCGRDDFTCISHLKKHRTSHTPEEKTNLVCPHSECGLTTNKGNIARHMKFKHPELVEASVRKTQEEA